MATYPGFERWAERVMEACRRLLGASAGRISLVGDDGKGSGCDPSTEENAGLESALLVPMTVDGRIVGHLGLSDKPGGFGDEDVQTASAFAEIASIAFQNSTALETLRRSEEALGPVLGRDATCRNAARALREAYAAVEARMSAQIELMLSNTERLTRETRERRRTEQALRNSETKYRIIADNAYDWDWWLAPDGRFIHMSASCKRITGHDPEEFSSELDLLKKVVHPDDRAVFAAHRDEIDRTLKGGSVEFRVVRPDGAHRWIAHECQPVFDEAGLFLGHRGSNRDVTKRREAEDALRRSQETLRELSTQLLRAQEEGRKRVARELHDGVNQTLTAIKFALESRLSDMTAADSAPGIISFEKIVSLVQHAIDEARRIQMDLRPPLLDDLGILATLSWFTREFESVYSHIRIERKIEATEEDIPHLLKIVIFRIVQEALNNVAKHSRADQVRVGLRSVGDGIELTIQDNGRGFDLETPSAGFGLMNMRERAELSGGTFEIQTAAGRGTAIKALWPPRQW